MEHKKIVKNIMLVAPLLTLDKSRTIDKLVNRDRLKMTKCVRYIQGKMGLVCTTIPISWNIIVLYYQPIPRYCTFGL